jgi:hypothetical protein
MNPVTATSSATTTHARVGLATNDNCVIKIFQISTQALDDRTCRNDVNDVFHFFNRFIFSAFGGSGFSTFFLLDIGIGC